MPNAGDSVLRSLLAALDEEAVAQKERDCMHKEWKAHQWDQGRWDRYVAADNRLRHARSAWLRAVAHARCHLTLESTRISDSVEVPDEVS